MPERRPFPPSPRRRALARQAGLSAASPLLVGAAAAGAAAAASVMLARAAATTIGGWIAAACDGRVTLLPRSLAPSGAGLAPLTPGARVPSGVGLAPDALPSALLGLVLPLLGIIAVIAIAAHLAQTRGVWLPRRRVEGAPALPPRRSAAAAFELASATIAGVTAFAWLWLTAPRLARAASIDDAAAAVAAFLATVAIAWVALGVLDALLRHAALGNALSMTAQEKREDDRLAAADPRWRAYRTKLARGAPDDAAIRDAVASAAVLVLGDDIAIAIAWDPARRPVPMRVATGRGARATQLLGLARRFAVPVQRDPALASALAGDGAVPEASWPRVAELVAAVRAR
jgi:type III secretion system FlhB-like substrate exporter